MSLYEEYSGKTDLMFRFVNLYEKYMSTFDRTAEPQVTIVERHILVSINDDHGITNTELAAMLGRTPGAITQIIVKLEQKGLVERVKHKRNAKVVHLYPTPQGVKIAISYKAQEIICMRKMMAQLESLHTEDELDAFWSVLNSFIPVIASFSE